MSKSFDEYSRTLNAYAQDRHPVGCSAMEIQRFEESQKITLPEDYRFFLSICGKQVDHFFTGSDFCFDDLPLLQQEGRQLIEESKAQSMPEGSIVFLMHQGYQFYFLNCEGVYYYYEGKSNFEKKYDSFKDFFCTVITRPY